MLYVYTCEGISKPINETRDSTGTKKDETKSEWHFSSINFSLLDTRKEKLIHKEERNGWTLLITDGQTSIFMIGLEKRMSDDVELVHDTQQSSKVDQLTIVSIVHGNSFCHEHAESPVVNDDTAATSEEKQRK